MDIMEQNWTFIDVELANPSRDSICALGIICFHAGKEVFRKHYLIDPETEFDPANISIHHITPTMVIGKPTFPDVWNEIVPWANHSVFIAHNAASMDICALCRTLDRYGLVVPRFLYFCTLAFSRRVLPNLKDHKLTSLCHNFELPNLLHHDPLFDAEMCKNLFFELTSKYYPTDSDIRIYNYQPPVQEPDKTPKERAEDALKNAFVRYIAPSPTLEFCNHTFCLTGNFRLGSRSEIENYIIAHGGTVTTRVTRQLNYLVVGSEGSDKYKFGDYGTKGKQAVALQERGCDIQIIRELDLYEPIKKKGE